MRNSFSFHFTRLPIPLKWNESAQMYISITSKHDISKIDFKHIPTCHPSIMFPFTDCANTTSFSNIGQSTHCKSQQRILTLSNLFKLAAFIWLQRGLKICGPRNRGAEQISVTNLRKTDDKWEDDRHTPVVTSTSSCSPRSFCTLTSA